MYSYKSLVILSNLFLGINFNAVNAAYEPVLVKKSGVSSIPSLVIILDGHCYIYRENVYTLAKIKGK